MENPRFDTYVAILTDDEGNMNTRFVTGIPGHNTAEWKAGQPAMSFYESYAKDIVFGLTLNGHAAAVIKVLHGVTLKNPGKES